LLLKLLDARENLSVQVHPSSAGGAPALGEPKTEWWYVLDAEPHAAVYAGFRPGADRMTLERAIKEGGCEPWLHRIPVRKGDSLFVPGGRIHAIGGGCLIAEVQQNSDTTFRVFDWNRKGPDGLPRALHREQSLRCIRFDDPAPALEPDLEQEGFFCEFFSVSALRLRESRPAGEQAGAIFLVAEGAVSVAGDFFQLGDWFLLPAEADGALLAPAGGSVLLVRVALPAVAGAPVY
jgi:mannose-6-phosphate isomerase